MSNPKNLAEALIAFQASVPTIHENDKSFHGKFANLPGVLSTINPALRKSGLTIVQLPETVDGKPGLRTTVMHISGEQMSAVTPLVIADGKNPVHEHGKSLTYIRRYSLLAALNLAIGIEDNDCDAEPSAPPVATPTQAPAKQAAAKPIADGDVPLEPSLKQELLDTIPALPGPYVEKFCKAFAVEFKTGQKKISECLNQYKHYTWSQDYFKANPIK